MILRFLICMAVMALAARVCARDIDLDDLLDLDLEDFVEVVAASKTSQRPHEVPATVRVITAEKIRENGYLTLEEALSDLPGFQLQNTFGLNSYIFLRGIPDQNQLLLVLVDGIQINDLGSGSFYGGGQYNLSSVKRIEVVYGPASSLYGTNAISGIVNIITRDPRDIREGHTSVALGNSDVRTADFSFRHYIPGRDVGFSMSGMIKQHDEAALPKEEGDSNRTGSMETSEDDLSLDGKLTVKGLTLGWVLQDKQTSFKSEGTGFFDGESDWHIRFINAYLKYRYNAKPIWSVQSLAYYRNSTSWANNSTLTEADTSVAGRRSEDSRPDDLFGIESQVNATPFRNLQITGGIVCEAERLTHRTPGTHIGSPGRESSVKPLRGPG